MANEQLPDEAQVPLVWTDTEETPIQFANQFLSQFQEGEFIITLGQVAPPALLGTEDERRAQLARLQWIPVRTLARVGLTRKRMAELVEVLTRNLAAHDQQQQIGGGSPE